MSQVTVWLQDKNCEANEISGLVEKKKGKKIDFILHTQQNKNILGPIANIQFTYFIVKQNNTMKNNHTYEEIKHAIG